MLVASAYFLLCIVVILCRIAERIDVADEDIMLRNMMYLLSLSVSL